MNHVPDDFTAGFMDDSMADFMDDGADVRTALATLVATEPPLPSGAADIERRGRRRMVRHRVGGGLAAAAVAIAAAGLAATSLGPGAGRPVADPPGPGASGGTATTTTPPPTPPPSDGPAGGTQPVSGFPIGAAAEAANTALPSGYRIGELTPEVPVAWREGGVLDLPLVAPAGNGILTLRVTATGCHASVVAPDLLSPADLDRVAAAVCAEWVAQGSPTIVAGGPDDPNAPGLAAS